MLHCTLPLAIVAVVVGLMLLFSRLHTLLLGHFNRLQSTHSDIMALNSEKIISVTELVDAVVVSIVISSMLTLFSLLCCQ